MNEFFQRVVQNIKINYLRLPLLIIGFGIVGYFLNMAYAAIVGIIAWSLLFIILQNSFLLTSSKNLFFTFFYGALSLWIGYLAFFGMFSKNNYLKYILYVLIVYFLYAIFQSFKLYMKQKKIELNVYMKILEELKNHSSISIQSIALNIGWSEEYISKVLASYIEDELMPKEALEKIDFQ